MKTIISIFASILLLSCNSNQTLNSSGSNSSNADSPVAYQDTTLYFQRLEGSANQDTSNIRLTFNGNTVIGHFNHTPYEKDSRRGTITATRNGNTITGIWAFMQEGLNDTLPVEFKLEANQLLQKAYSVDQSTGRQILTDTSNFIIYSPVDKF